MLDALQNFHLALDEHFFAFTFGLVDDFESVPLVRGLVPTLVYRGKVPIADFVVDIELSSNQSRIHRLGLKIVSWIGAINFLFCFKRERLATPREVS